MALDNAKNFAKVEVSTGYDASATTVVLSSTEGLKLPTAPFNVTWYNSTDYTDPTDDPNVEIVRVTVKSTDTLTVTRAQEGTTAKTHNTGGKTYKMIAGLTAKVINTDLSANLVPQTYLDTDGTLAANSDVKVATQKATKTYVDTTVAAQKDVTETLTNKTITLPTFTNGAISFNFQEPGLINGTILPSVSSNNLTLSIKTFAGTDPAPTDPVYVRINNTIRSITAALSVTLNAGTNWFSAGATQLATQEVDYFAYIGYNATDGVVLGFSRIPYYREYSQFSTTSTDGNYLAVSSRANAAAGDDYVNIGRFAAILGASATYYWSIPTLSNINLINSQIYSTRLLTVTPTWTNVTLGNGTASGAYTLNYREAYCFLTLTMGSTSSMGTSATCTLPITMWTSPAYLGFSRFYDSSATTPYPGYTVFASTSTVTPTAINASSTYGYQAGTTSSAPFTWAVNDTIQVEAKYWI